MGVHSRDHIFSTSRRLWLWTSGVFRTKDLCSFVRRSHLCLKTLMGSGCRPSLCRQARFLPRKTREDSSREFFVFGETRNGRAPRRRCQRSQARAAAVGQRRSSLLLSTQSSYAPTLSAPRSGLGSVCLREPDGCAGRSMHDRVRLPPRSWMSCCVSGARMLLLLMPTCRWPRGSAQHLSFLGA